MEINNLVENCIKSAIEFGVATYEAGESARKRNHLYDKNFKNFKTLKSLGSKGIDELEKLLEHSSDYVKYSAATHLLSVKEEKAKMVLNRLVSKPKGFGFNVDMLIIEWDQGNLREYLG
ncbi:DUF2019 domain-containing protein [Neobacillus sp. YIM B06451]|uniref:DUF2019 domain-containing protein n=1 Tax=Neobacillus sp. YIM B06451 TaxID=3070994 RepID=UPI00293190DC|nr:DUF2019 domain-containing protein [Neobacillus sp. YIM B06451]